MPVRLQSKVEIGLDLSVREQAALQPELHLARRPVQQKSHDDGGTEEPDEGDEELGPEHAVRGGRASAPPQAARVPAPHGMVTAIGRARRKPGSMDGRLLDPPSAE